MSTAKVIAVDQVLVFSQHDTQDTVVDAFLTTMVFALAAGRSQVRDRRTQQDYEIFTNAWRTKFGSLGWIITHASRGYNVTRSLANRTTTLASELTNTMAGSSDAGSPGVPNVLAALAKEVEDSKTLSPELESLLRFWWDNAKESSGLLYMGIGTLSQQTSGSTVGPACYLTVLSIDTSKITRPKPGLLSSAPDFDATTWQSLFVKISDDVEMSPVQSIAGTLDMATYRNQESDIKKALQGRAPDHYHMAELSVSPA